MWFLTDFVLYSHQLTEGPFVLAVIALAVFAFANYSALTSNEKWYIYLGVLALDLLFALFMGGGLLWWGGLLCLIGGFGYHKLLPLFGGRSLRVGSILTIVFGVLAGVCLTVLVFSFFGDFAIIHLKVVGKVLFGVLTVAFAAGGLVIYFRTHRRSTRSSFMPPSP